jgi:hypothetical protein
MAVVYKHQTKDTNIIFYIGIGKSERRAFSTTQRTEIWKNIVNKHGYVVEVLYKDLSWEEACKKEQELIRFYGKKSLGTGTLVNITDGGDGRLGAYPSEETRKKMSESHKGMNTWSKGCKHSEETKLKLKDYYKKHGGSNKGKIKTEEQKRKISESLKKRPNGNNWLGRKHSEETKLKMSIAKTGENNTRYGTTHSDETKNKMSEAAKLRDNKKYSRKKSEDEKKKLSDSSKNRQKVECPFCNKIGDITGMKRWHFDNCKSKKETI